ncbi:hypothetical protein [Oryzomicrobium sp.]|uniref:hypothetical protein n=1 Tax=Oryzomicrobium sp. TaxID=1911578 RepID=UPI0025D30CDB|nr:hypothetical protein [Oryzomicrobium sp.]
MTAKQFPTVQFSGDTDMVTDGWLSLTSVNQLEIVITQATADEYRAIAQDNDGYLKVEHRINAALGRIDLRCSWLVSVEEVAKTAQGTSFQESQKSYQPPKLLFKDIFAQDSVATETSRTSRSEFECNGGKLVVLQ